MKRLKCLLVIFTIFACFLNSCSSQSPQNKGKEVEFLKELVVPKAYEVIDGYDNKLSQTAISYKVKLKYPSMEVLKFCDNKLAERGWQKKIECTPDKGDRGWIRFIEGTMKGEPLVHQLFATWNNKEKSKMIALQLRYYSYNLSEKEKLSTDIPNTDILSCIIQVGPYVEMPKNNYSERDTSLEISKMAVACQKNR